MTSLRRTAVLTVLALLTATVGVVLAPAAVATPLASTGTQRVLVLRAYWDASPPASPTDTEAQTVLDGVRSWFTGNARVAGGTSVLDLTFQLTDWLPVSPPSGGCSADRAALLAHAKEAASGYAPDTYQAFVVALPDCPGDPATWSTQGGEGVWLNGSAGFTRGTIINGLGHNMGLPTAQAMDCAQGDQQPPCDTSDDSFSPVGDVLGFGASAPERVRLGWLAPSQVKDLSAGGSASLVALTQPESAVATIVAGGRTYWLETRRAELWDADLGTAGTSGVLVHEVNSDPQHVPVLDNTRPVSSDFSDHWTIPPSGFWVTTEGFVISVRSGLPNGFLTVDVAPPPRLTVGRAGTGSGSVTVTPGGSVCPPTCSIAYRGGTVVSLTATPSAGSTFTGWSGDCSGTGTCSLTMNGDRVVTASFTSTSTRAEESAAGLDGWAVIVGPGASGGTWRSSSTKGNTATFTSAPGTAVTWLTRKGPKYGVATVTIDGVSKGTVNLAGSTEQPFAATFAGLPSRVHKVVVKVTGTHSAPSSGNGVVVDGFSVGTTTTQESAKTVVLDAWKAATAAGASGGLYRSTAKLNATATYAFTGTRVDWITAKGPNRGKAAVSIDGGVPVTVDLYAGSTQLQAVGRSFTGLTAGPHRITVKVLATKNPASSGASVPVDAFVVG